MLINLADIKTPEGYSRLDFTKLGKHRVVLISDWVTPYGVVPAGFKSDGASIPRWAWWFSHPFAELLEGSVLHDWHYENAIGSKPYADSIFDHVIKAYRQFNGTSDWKIKIANLLVRKFGRGTY